MIQFRSLRAVFLAMLLTLFASPMVGQETVEPSLDDGTLVTDYSTDTAPDADTVEMIEPGVHSRFDSLGDIDASQEYIVSDAVRGRACNKRCGCPKCCAAQCNLDPYNRLLPQNGWMSVRGWVDGGILGNTSNPPSHFNGPYNATEVDNGQLNQFYLVMERTMAADGSWTYRARCDLLYGSDYFLAQSTGFELNPDGTPRWNANQFDGLALPQAYVEVGTKYNSIKMGHFYTLVGYEGVQSPTNFFYSHAYSYMFVGPFTQWGAIGSSKLGDNWHLQGGIVNGWNNLVGSQNHGNFLGNIKYTGAGWWGSLAVILGEEFDNLANLPNVAYAYTNRTRYSAIFDKQIGSNFEYLFA